MWALSDFSLYLDPRTDPALPSLMACLQKKQIPPGGNAWYPSLLEQWRWWVLPSHPPKTRAATLSMGTDTKPCPRCAQGAQGGPVSPKEVPGSVKFIGWDQSGKVEKFLLPTLLGTAFLRTSSGWDPVRSQTQHSVKARAQHIAGGPQHNTQDQPCMRSGRKKTCTGKWKPTGSACQDSVPKSACGLNHF